MSAVEFRHVNFQIGDRRILNDLTLAIEPGETLVLLGRSGSGKTTALRLINGMIMPTSGEIHVEGQTTLRWDLVRLRRGIGYVIQDGGLFPHFTVERNIALVPSLDNQRAEVGVARALAANPKILLFDEPFGALDPVTRLELQREFIRLRNELGKTSVFVTHDVQEATKLATRIALLHEGSLVFIGAPEEFRRSRHPEALAFQDVLNAQ
jgi:osmoprotectant transport system ATP-binding protein